MVIFPLGNAEQGSWLNRRYSDATAERMDQAVKDVIEVIFERTLALLNENRALLETSSAELLERETLEDADLKRIAVEVVRPADAA